MSDSASCASSTGSPITESASTENPSTSKTFEKSGPRRKARRSCSNCQRAHKTCGNERPCVQCIKRGLELECVDGNRKPPKYLRCDLPPRPVAHCLRCAFPVAQSYARKPFDLTCTARRRTDFGSKSTGDHPKFIDPALLHSETQTTKRLSRDEANPGPRAFSQLLHDPLWTEVPSSPSGQNGITMDESLPDQAMNNLYEKILAETLAIDLLRPQISNIDGYDEHGGGMGVQERRPSSGIAISIGWSSTFFPGE
ncbi:Zn(II)2Cys6 transcription factor domain-containing protein [Aspergillus lucknowensis]|uniref:Transcription activator of gluconeogenesis acuK n=1 Tax=Aspergillus lucknowensis TaxID=176173 RepID=A0ABR4M0H7_9EURO